MNRFSQPKPSLGVIQEWEISQLDTSPAQLRAGTSLLPPVPPNGDTNKRNDRDTMPPAARARIRRFVI